MQYVYTIFNQIIILSIIGLIGFIAGRMKYLPENTGFVISRLIVNILAPFLIFSTMSKYKFTPDVLADGFTVYILGIAFMLLSFGIGAAVSKILKLSGTTASVFKMHSVFGNVVFLAYPLIDAMYPDKGLMYAIFYALANDTVLWTLGIYLVNSHNNTNWKKNLKHLINGNTIAFALGLLCMFGNLQYYVENNPIVERIYNITYDSLGSLGRTTIYMSMLFIGLILSEVRLGNFKELIGRYPLFILTFLKLIAIPAIGLGVFMLFGNLVDPFIKKIVILLLAMPCGTIVAALSAQYESDYRFASECVFFSTITGIFTLPLIVYLLQFV